MGNDALQPNPVDPRVRAWLPLWGNCGRAGSAPTSALRGATPADNEGRLLIVEPSLLTGAIEWGRCSLVATNADDRVAPIPVVRLTTIGRLKSTHNGRSTRLTHSAGYAPRRHSRLRA